MAASLNSVEDVVNAALVRIGFRDRIGSIWEGSEASKAAIDIYAQTRDAVLRSQAWGFAERDLALTLLKTAPPGGYGITAWSSAYPILPFIYEYSYPSDCLDVRSLRSTPPFMPVFDPVPNTFRIANDNSLAPPARVILTNLKSAICVYTAQVTDMTTWEPMFGESLIAALAERMPAFMANLELKKFEAQDEAAMTGAAIAKLG